MGHMLYLKRMRTEVDIFEEMQNEHEEARARGGF